jgi:hypothetical protein
MTACRFFNNHDQRLWLLLLLLLVQQQSTRPAAAREGCPQVSASPVPMVTLRGSQMQCPLMLSKQ